MPNDRPVTEKMNEKCVYLTIVKQVTGFFVFRECQPGLSISWGKCSLYKDSLRELQKFLTIQQAGQSPRHFWLELSGWPVKIPV